MENMPPEAMQFVQQFYGMFAFAAGFFMIMMMFMLVVAIFALMNAFHLVTTDSPKFKGGMDGKKKWFYLFYLLPFAVIIVPLSPFVGLAWIILQIFYFFSIRKWQPGQPE